MSGTGSDDTPFDGLADQCHVTDNIEQFVACRFIFPYQRFVVQISFFCGIVMGNSDTVSQLVQFLLGHLVLINHDRVVQVSAFDETGGHQLFYFTNKNESTARGDFRFEILHVVQSGKLAGKNFGIE